MRFDSALGSVHHLYIRVRACDVDLDLNSDDVVQSAELAGILLAFSLSEPSGIKNVLRNHPSIASPHSTDENDELPCVEAAALSAASTTTCHG
jgi:hypothetical protein